MVPFHALYTSQRLNLTVLSTATLTNKIGPLAGAQKSDSGGSDALGIRYPSPLQGWCARYRRVRPCHSPDRSVEIRECRVRDSSCDLGAPSSGQMVLLDDENATGFSDRGLDGGHVKWHEAANVNYLGVDSQARQPLRRG